MTKIVYCEFEGWFQKWLMERHSGDVEILIENSVMSGYETAYGEGGYIDTTELKSVIAQINQVIFEQTQHIPFIPNKMEAKIC